MRGECVRYVRGMQSECKENATGPLLQAKRPVQETVAQLFRQLLRELAQSPETMHKQYETSPGKATKVATHKKTRLEIERERVSGRKREKKASSWRRQKHRVFPTCGHVPAIETQFSQLAKHQAHSHTCTLAHTHIPIQLQMQFTIFTPIAIKAVSEIHT